MSGSAKFGVVITLIIALIIGAIGLVMYTIPKYLVWQQGLAGSALLKRAQQEKQIMIEQARAEVEASQLRKQAIETIGQAAKDYPEYRQQEFIAAFAKAMENGAISKIIYVPTEANIPIIEARTQ